MTAKSAALSNELLKLIFQGVAIAGIADPAAGGVETLWLTLHTQDPGKSGNQSTNEVAYTGFERVAVVRSASGWVVNNNQVSPVSAIEFPEMVGGANGTATHASVGLSQTGAGKILYRGALTPQVPYTVGVTPRLRATTVITED